MNASKPFDKMRGYVHRSTDGASTAAAERTSGSPTPAPRKEGGQQNVFLKPTLPTTSLKQSQQSNAAAVRTGSRHQQHPVLERQQATRISTFDTDGESVADTTLDDTSTLSNPTYQNQQYSYLVENNAMDIDHLPTAAYANNFANSEVSPYSVTVPKVEELGVAGDSRYEHGLTPAIYEASMHNLSTLFAEYREAHANPGAHSGAGIFQSGASYPATSKSGLTDTEMRGIQEDVGSDDEREQSEESQDEEGESSEDDAPPDQHLDGPEEHEIYGEQERQVPPRQRDAAKRSDQYHHEKPLASRSASHQRAVEPGQGQYVAVLVAQQDDARVKQEAELIEQKRRDQALAKEKLILEQEQQNRQWASQEQAKATSTAQKKQPQNGSQQRFSDSAQQQRPSNIARAQKSGSNGNHQPAIVPQQAAPHPATRQVHSEAWQNARLDAKETSLDQPDSVPEVARQGEKPVELDYDEAALKKMPYDMLRNQSFDENPQPTKSALPDGMQSMELDEKLAYVTSLDGEVQQSFFQSLSLDDWESAGEWFMDQFGALMKKMRQTRQEKRQIAMGFEEAVSERYDVVCRKREQIDNVLDGMRQSGSVVLNVGSTPQKTKRA